MKDQNDFYLVLFTLWKTLPGDNVQLKNYYRSITKVFTNPLSRMSENSRYVFQPPSPKRLVISGPAQQHDLG